MRTSACVATYVDLQQVVDVVVVQTLKSRFYHIIRARGAKGVLEYTGVCLKIVALVVAAVAWDNNSLCS